MNGEIVSITTPDYLRLHGLYCPAVNPSVVSPRKGSTDAALIVHGLGGNFYSSRLLFHFARTLLDLGLSVVIVNTRGHDMVNTSTWAGRAQSVGAAFEDVDHCRHDLHGWVEFLLQRNYENVLLLGHSLGAIKSLYAQAYQPHPRVRAMVGLSATRLSYEKMIQSPRGGLLEETLRQCQSLVDRGAAETPVHVEFPFPTWMTPGRYLDKYGPAEKFNWTKFIDRVEVPTLLLFGEKELNENPAFDGLADELRVIGAQWNAIDVEIVPGADHFYSGKLESVADSISRWLS